MWRVVALTCRRNKQAGACRSNLATTGLDKLLLQPIELRAARRSTAMTRKPTTDDDFDRATLREAANGLTNDLIDQLHDIFKHTTQENRKGAREPAEDGNPEYLALCDREGPACDCEVVCKHKPKDLYAEREKAFARSEQQRRRFFRSQAQKG
jgi:hypothetical protein